MITSCPIFFFVGSHFSTFEPGTNWLRRLFFGLKAKERKKAFNKIFVLFGRIYSIFETYPVSLYTIRVYHGVLTTTFIRASHFIRKYFTNYFVVLWLSLVLHLNWHRNLSLSVFIDNFVTPWYTLIDHAFILWWWWWWCCYDVRYVTEI